MTRERRLLGIALLVDLLGATGVLLSVGRDWQRVVVTRHAPLTDAVVHLSGRDLEAAISGLGFVALAGVVALAATRGIGRRLVGAALAISGGVIIWLTVLAMTPVSTAEARDSVPSGVGVDSTSRAHATVTAGWPIVTLVSGLLIVLAGVLTVFFARHWMEMAARYDAPTPAAREAGRSETANGDGGTGGADGPNTVADLALWSALDRGDDPTARTEP
jgi:uncharacterized membrane protein (TIGR02234 family)